EARIRRRKQQSQIRRQVETLVDDLKDAQRKLDWKDDQEDEADRDGEAREDPIAPAQAAGDHEDPKGAHRGPGRRERDAGRNGKARGGPIDRARAAGDRFRWLCRLARGLGSLDDLKGPDRAAAAEALERLKKADREDLKGRSLGEHLVRAAAIQRAEA